jgi:hypothetical protein
MYEPEQLIKSGPITDPEPPRNIPAPPHPELYNIAEDPTEKENLADQYPDITKRLLMELETWFEQVERERATIEDEW